MKDPNIGPMFACLYPGLCDIARNNGYALAIHGSIVTDLDLVAIPWTEAAVPAVDLMLAIRGHLGALDYRSLLRRDCTWATDQNIEQMVAGEQARWKYPAGEHDCELKPHGRKAWNLYLQAGVKIDLSVMPRA